MNFTVALHILRSLRLSDKEKFDLYSQLAIGTHTAVSNLTTFDICMYTVSGDSKVLVDKENGTTRLFYTYPYNATHEKVVLDLTISADEKYGHYVAGNDYKDGVNHDMSFYSEHQAGCRNATLNDLLFNQVIELDEGDFESELKAFNYSEDDEPSPSGKVDDRGSHDNVASELKPPRSVNNMIDFSALMPENIFSNYFFEPLMRKFQLFI